MKKLLLLSVSAGAGHVRAAEALRAWGAEAFADRVDTRHIDVMDHVPASFRKIYTDGYIKLVQHLPKMWGLLYDASSKTPPDALSQKLRRSIERLSTRALMREIAAFAPDAIVCTHFLPAELLARKTKRGHFSIPIWVQVTDFDLHGMWAQPEAAGYFAANDEVKFRLQARGIAPGRVHVTGIPIMPQFSRKPDRATCARELGASPAKRTVLLMGGGAGVGGLDEVAERLLANENPSQFQTESAQPEGRSPSRPRQKQKDDTEVAAPERRIASDAIISDFQLIVLAGKNQKALAALAKLSAKYPSRLVPQGFTDKVERIMACADLIITKPGGLTTSEALALGLPMIVHSPIPGQEERNADYLLEEGVALKAIDENGLEFRLKTLLADPPRLAAMRTRATALGRPHAGRDALSILLDATP
jgi:processive 1,2-diacylglycerol beta-glucosyltransferase